MNSPIPSLRANIAAGSDLRDPIAVIKNEGRNPGVGHRVHQAVGVDNSDELCDSIHDECLYGAFPAIVKVRFPVARDLSRAGMFPHMSTVLERIDQRLTALDISARKASLEAGLGADYIRDLRRKKTASPGIAAIEKLAPVLETTMEWLSSGDGEPPAWAGGYRDPPPILGEEDLPVYRAAEAGPGYIVVTEKPTGHVARPSKLSSNPDAFAVVVAGESMSPEYEPGDMLFVDPYKPLVRGRNFIFVDDTHGDWKACVKRLTSWDHETYQVYQHNPPKGQGRDFTLQRAEWPKALRVLGKFDRD